MGVEEGGVLDVLGGNDARDVNVKDVEDVDVNAEDVEDAEDAEDVEDVEDAKDAEDAEDVEDVEGVDAEDVEDDGDVVGDDLIDALESYPEMASVTIILVFDAVIIQYGVVAGVKKFTH